MPFKQLLSCTTSSCVTTTRHHHHAPTPAAVRTVPVLRALAPPQAMVRLLAHQICGAASVREGWPFRRPRRLSAGADKISNSTATQIDTLSKHDSSSNSRCAGSACRVLCMFSFTQQQHGACNPSRRRCSRWWSAAHMRTPTHNHHANTHPNTPVTLAPSKTPSQLPPPPDAQNPPKTPQPVEPTASPCLLWPCVR